MKKVFIGFVIASAVIYIFFLYYMLFRLVGRQMVIMSDHMLDNYNYWNSVNLIPFRTITQYGAAAVGGSMRGQALRNLFGNMVLFFPAGFYLPFFVKKVIKIKIFSIAMAVVIIAVEIIQLATMTGSLDIDDFILNFAGAFIGFTIFTRTPLHRLFN